MSDPLNLIADALSSEAEARRLLEKLREAGFELELHPLGDTGESDDISITPEMLRAGFTAFLRDGDYSSHDRVEEIYLAMERARRKATITGSGPNS